MRLLTLGLIGAALISTLSIISTPVLFALANAPALFFDGNRTDGVVFSPQTGQKLDIYTPKRTGENLKPVVVFFYGGSWEWGERADYEFVGMTLANEGFVTVIPDYRKYPDVRFPAFVEDGAEAVAWVRATIRAYGGDPEQVHVMGHSAGAHIGAMLTLDEQYLLAAGASGAIDSFVGLAGPYDFTPEAKRFVDMFGPPERFPLMKPVNFVDGDEPAMLLMHGLQDGTVADQNSRALNTRVTNASGCAETKFYPEIGHIGIISAFSWVFRDSKPMVGDVVAFLKRQTAQPGC